MPGERPKKNKKKQQQKKQKKQKRKKKKKNESKYLEADFSAWTDGWHYEGSCGMTEFVSEQLDQTLGSGVMDSSFGISFLY